MPALSAKPAALIEYGVYCEDLDRTAAWYQGLFGFPQLLEESGRLRALQAGPQQVLLLFQRGGSVEGVVTPGAGFIPRHDGYGDVHLAFAMEPGEVETWQTRLREAQIKVESAMQWPEGGTSLYFRDPDGHLVELITPRQWHFQDWPPAAPNR